MNYDLILHFAIAKIIFVKTLQMIINILGLRAPAFAMSFRGPTNPRGKIGTARSLV